MEEQPSTEVDMGNQDTAEKDPDQSMQMVSRDGGSRVQNKPITQKDKTVEASTSNRFTILGECGQSSVQGNALMPEPIQQPP